MEKYQFHSRLGAGAFGEVWHAKDRWLDIDVAVKFPYQQDLDIDTLCYEGRMVAALASPGIVPIRTIERIRGLTALVFDFMSGGSIGVQCRPDGIQDCSKVVRYFRNVGLGLAAAHCSGILHRDIKPDNMLIDSSGEARLTDFGLAAHTGHSMVFGGTLPYMAPECWRREYTVSTDIFALGVSLYESLTGVTPHDSSGGLLALVDNIAQGRFAPLNRRRDVHVPARLVKLVNACLSPKCESRPKDALDFVSRMQESDSPLLVTSASGVWHTEVSCTLRGVLDVCAEGICYSANNNLVFGGGTSGVVLKAAGKKLGEAAKSLIERRGPVPVGHCAITGAFELSARGCRKVLHLAALDFDPVQHKYRWQRKDYFADISRAVTCACRLAAETKLSSLAMTLMGTRVGRLSVDQSAACIIRGIHGYLLDAGRQNTGIERIYLCASGSEAARRAFAKQLSLIRCVSRGILDSDCETIVVSANNWLVPGTGIAKLAAERGGAEVTRVVLQMRRQRCPLALGSAVEVPSGGIRAGSARKAVIYAVAMGYREFDGKQARNRILATPDSVYRAVVSALRLASEKGSRSIALPLMCARPHYSEVPIEQAPSVMFRTMVRAVNDLRPELTMDRIEIVIDPGCSSLSEGVLLRGLDD